MIQLSFKDGQQKEGACTDMRSDNGWTDIAHNTVINIYTAQKSE